MSPAVEKIFNHIRSTSSGPIALSRDETFEVAQLLAGHVGSAPSHGGWIHATQAAELTGENRRTLRQKATRWLQQYERGEIVDVRVQKTSETRNGHWKFSLHDCIRYGLQRGIPEAIEEAALRGLSTTEIN